MTAIRSVLNPLFARACSFLLAFAMGLGGTSVFGETWTPNASELAIATALTQASGQRRPFMVADPILSRVARARAAGVSLAVTTHLTTDVAAIPLLWVLPLTAYSMSFIVAFGRRSRNSECAGCVAYESLK